MSTFIDHSIRPSIAHPMHLSSSQPHLYCMYGIQSPPTSIILQNASPPLCTPPDCRIHPPDLLRAISSSLVSRQLSLCLSHTARTGRTSLSTMSLTGTVCPCMMRASRCLGLFPLSERFLGWPPPLVCCSRPAANPQEPFKQLRSSGGREETDSAVFFLNKISLYPACRLLMPEQEDCPSFRISDRRPACIKY